MGPRAREIRLYGSRARRDACKDSDYDVLIVLDSVNSSDSEAISSLVARFFLEEGALIAPIVISLSQWNRNTYEPLFIRIRKEGIRL
jgi:predicted nucleotidyltransferase